MRKEISTIILLAILIIAVLGLASAITIYSGESYSFESEEFEYYTVVGNSSNMEGMNISWENGNTTINFAYNYAPDNFTLILIDKSNEEIIKEVIVNSGGGGSSIRYVDRNVTEYVTVTEFIEKIKYLENNATAFDNIGDLEIPEIKTEKSKWFLGKFWNWLKELFK